MRLAEYLFSNPGGPPQPDYGDNYHMATDRGEEGLSGRAIVPHAYPMGEIIAQLDGQPIHHLAHGYSQDTAMRYRHMLGEARAIDWSWTKGFLWGYHHIMGSWEQARDVTPETAEQWLEIWNKDPNPNHSAYRVSKRKPSGKPKPEELRAVHESVEEAKQYWVKDKAGNKLAVEMLHDKDDDEYVALVRGGRYRKTASGSERQDIRISAYGKTPAEAVKALGRKLGESVSGHSVLTLSEVLKKGKNEPSARDRKAISRLQDGKYPDKAEDGKGFCFQWADGRGICAFKMRSDALRWAKAEPRDIVKFWYGEPVHSNGKFRIRVADHYSKEEAVDASIVQRAARQFVEEGSIDFKKLLSDPDTRHGWVANLAMAISDTRQERGEPVHDWRQRCAERFLDLLAPKTRTARNESVETFSSLLERRARVS